MSSTSIDVRASDDIQTPLALDLEKIKRTTAELTGEVPLPDGTSIYRRATWRERKVIREYLSQTIKSTGLEPQIHEYRKFGENVYGMLPATQSSPSTETVVIGAHFDSYPGRGAIDNATSVALTLELARTLKTIDCRNRNLLFVFFDEEETGIVGSRMFAKTIPDKLNLKIHSAHTMDEIGWDSDNDRAVELELPSQKLRALYSQYADLLKIPLLFNDSEMSDHASFRSIGIDSVGITDEFESGDDHYPYAHTRADSYSKVNFTHVDSTGKLILAVLEELLSCN